MIGYSHYAVRNLPWTTLKRIATGKRCLMRHYSRYLDAHPELQRYDFLREISQHSDCLVIGRGQGIKVRIKP